MLLDIGGSSTKITGEDNENPNGALLSHTDDNIDEFDKVMDDFLKDTCNETSLNCNGDVSKIAINDILQEMRLHSPIENDFLSDLFGDEPNNIFCEIGNNNIKEEDLNGNYYDHNFNQNHAFQEHNTGALTSDDNLLDSLLPDVSCSTPEVQMEFDDGIQFQYNAVDQFNGEPDMTLSFPETDITLPSPKQEMSLPCPEPDITLRYPEPDSTTLSIEDGSGLNVNFEAINNYDRNNEVNYNREQVLNEPNTVSDNQYFPCSTPLPMTSEELQKDIKNYLNTEPDYSYVSFYEYVDMINGTADAQRNITNNCPYNSKLFEEYIDERKQFVQTLDTIDPNNVLEKPMPPPEAQTPATVFQCSQCAFFTHSYQGLNAHKRVHASDQLSSCAESNEMFF